MIIITMLHITGNVICACENYPTISYIISHLKSLIPLIVVVILASV